MLLAQRPGAARHPGAVRAGLWGRWKETDLDSIVRRANQARHPPCPSNASAVFWSRRDGVCTGNRHAPSQIANKPKIYHEAPKNIPEHPVLLRNLEVEK
jgi:hypothetical protein